MNTLIELYDDRAIENILAPDMFRPERIFYLCPDEIAGDYARQDSYRAFFESRGWKPALSFLPCSMYDCQAILKQLQAIRIAYPDCCVDVTGGTDAALFAAGMFAATGDLPAFTYSRRMNSFFNILNAPFAENVPCSLRYKVEDFFRIAGGRMRPGRVDNRLLGHYLPLFDGFFDLFLTYQQEWTDCITWFQKAAVDPDTLAVQAAMTLKGERGHSVTINTRLLRQLVALGMLRDLKLTEEGDVSFTFQDEMIRGWLRDVGSVLELYVYKACLNTGIFNDVISSAIVDWNDAAGHETVSNEIDAVAVAGIRPLFISCKTCAIKTEALNELAILRDRFGGKGAKALIITAEKCNAAARHRAAQLDIAVIDPEELEHEALLHRLKVIMKVPPE